MRFLQPEFLWTLPVLLIPVLLHLFNLQRTEKVIFSNTRMLENLVKETSKARNLRHLLLLLLRLLALACIILAFAQPVLSEEQGGTEDNFIAAAVYVDDSYSMNLPDDNSTALERAIAYASAVPQFFGSKGWFRLNTNSDQAGRSWTSGTGLKEQLQEIQKSSRQKSPANILRQAYQQLALRNSSEKKHLYLISDFQKDFWDIKNAGAFDSAVQHHFIPVLHAADQNVWIDSAWENQSAASPGKIEIRFRINSSGIREPKILQVQLYEGKNLQAGRQVEIKPGQMLETSLSIQQKMQEIRCLYLEVEDSSVPWDNRFYLSLKSPAPFQVYRLGDKPNPVLLKLFRSSQAFVFREGSLLNPAYDALEKSSLILLDKPEALSEGLAARLKSLVKSGAVLCVLPSATSLAILNSSAMIPFRAEELATGNPASARGKVLLPEASNSFFRSVFDNPGKNSALPESRAFLNLNGQGFPMLRFESGQVFLSRFTDEKGSWFVFSSDPSAMDANFHRHPLMLASFFRMASAARTLESNPMFVSRNQSRIFLNPDSGALAGEGQAELRHEGKRIQAGLGTSGNRSFLQSDFRELQEGFWEVWQNNRKIDVLAVNRDPAESKLNFLTATELKTLLPNRPWIKISELKSAEKTEFLKAGVEQGMPLWKWLLACAILFLLAEAALNRKMALNGRAA